MARHVRTFVARFNYETSPLRPTQSAGGALRPTFVLSKSDIRFIKSFREGPVNSARLRNPLRPNLLNYKKFREDPPGLYEARQSREKIVP